MAFTAEQLGIGGPAPAPEQEQEQEVPYLDLMVKTAKENNLPADAFVAQFEQESAFNPQAVGPQTRYGTAKGIAQFIDPTAQRFGVTDPFDPAQAIPAAGKYMAQLRDRFGGNYDFALAGYNAGEGNVDKYGGVPPFAETQDYISKINEKRKKYGHLVAPDVAATSAPQPAQPAAGIPSSVQGEVTPSVGRFDITPPTPPTLPSEARRPSILSGAQLGGGSDIGPAMNQFIRDNIGGWFPSEQVRGGDFVDLLQSGTIGLASGLVSLGAYGANSVFGQGAGDAFQSGANALDAWAQRNVDAISPEAKHKLAKEFLSSKDSAFLDPTAIGLKLAHTAPSIIPSLAVGYGMALKGLKMWQVAAGAGATEAGIAGGAAANEISQMIQGMSYDELKNAFPEEMLMAEKAGMSPDQVKDLVITAAQNEAVLPTMATTGMLGAVAGGAIGKIMRGTGPAGIRKRAARGFVAEAGTEAPQSGLEQYWQNKALNRPAMEGVWEQFTAGGVLGGLLGAGPAVVFGSRGEEEPTAVETRDQIATDTQGLTDSATAAAVEAAQQLELPLESGTQVMTTPTPPPSPEQAGAATPTPTPPSPQLGLPLDTPPPGPSPAGVGGGGPITPTGPTDVTYPTGGGISADRIAAAQRGETLPPREGPVQYAPGYGNLTDEALAERAAVEEQARQESFTRAQQAQDQADVAEAAGAFEEVARVREQEEAEQALTAQQEQEVINRAIDRFNERRAGALEATPEVRQMGLDFGEQPVVPPALPPRGEIQYPPGIPATDEFRGIGQQADAASPGVYPPVRQPPYEAKVEGLTEQELKQLEELRLALALRAENAQNPDAADVAMSDNFNDESFMGLIEQEANGNPKLLDFFPADIREMSASELPPTATPGQLGRVMAGVTGDLIETAGYQRQLAEPAQARLQGEQMDMFQEELDAVLSTMRAAMEKANIAKEKNQLLLEAVGDKLYESRQRRKEPDREAADIKKALERRRKSKTAETVEELTPGQQYYLSVIMNAAEDAGLSDIEVEQLLSAEGVYDRLPELDETAETKEAAKPPTGLTREQRQQFFAKDMSAVDTKAATELTGRQRVERQVEASKKAVKDKGDKAKTTREVSKDEIRTITNRMSRDKAMGGLGLVDQLGQLGAQINIIREVFRKQAIRNRNAKGGKLDITEWVPNVKVMNNLNEVFDELGMIPDWSREDFTDILDDMREEGGFYDYEILTPEKVSKKAEDIQQKQAAQPKLVSPTEAQDITTEVEGIPLTQEEITRRATTLFRNVPGDLIEEAVRRKRGAKPRTVKVDKGEVKVDKKPAKKTPKAEAVKAKSKARAAAKKKAIPKPAAKKVEAVAPDRDTLVALRDTRVTNEKSVNKWANEVKDTFKKFGLNTTTLTRLINKHGNDPKRLKAEVKSRISSALQSLRKTETKTKPPKKAPKKKKEDVEQEVSYERDEAEAAETGTGSASISERPEYYRPADDGVGVGGRGSYVILTGPSRKPPYRISGTTYQNRAEPSQLYGAEVILSKLIKDTNPDQEAIVLLGDGTGFGKTRQMLIAAEEFKKSFTGENKSVLFVVKNEGNKSTIKRQAKELGVEAPNMITYQALRTNRQSAETRDLVSGKYGMIVYDEAHEIRNPDADTVSAVTSLHKSSEAKKIVYATATPADHESSMYLMYDMLRAYDMLPTGVTSYDQFLDGIGITYKDTGGMRNIKTMEYKVGSDAVSVANNLANYHEKLRGNNSILARQLPPLAIPEIVNVKNLVNNSNYEGDAKQFLNAIINSEQNPLTVLGHSIIAEEAAKVRATIKEIDTALKNGDNVVLFAGRHQKSKVKTRAGTYEVPSILEGVIDALKAKGMVVGRDFQPVVGRDASVAVQRKFQDPDDPMRVILTTTAKSGVSIDLDSQPGMPRRTVIMTQVPWSAIDIDQAIGRVDRRTTDPDNPPRILIMTSNGYGDSRRMGVINRKVKNMQAVRSGMPPQLGDALQDKIEKQAAEIGKNRYHITEGKDGGINIKLMEWAFNKTGGMFGDAIDLIKKAGGKPVPGMRLYWYVPKKNRDTILAQLDRLSESGDRSEALPRSSRMASTPTVFNNEINTLLFDAVRANKDLRLPEILDFIGQRKTWLGRLARIAKSYGIDIPVYAGDVDMFAYPDSMGEYQFDTEGNKPANRRIVVRLDDPDIAQTIMHETFHAITSHALVTNNEFAMELDRLRKEVANAFTTTERELYEDALGNVDEFVTEAINNRSFQLLLQETHLDTMPAWKKIWLKVANAFRRIFNMPIQSGVFSQIMEQVEGVTLRNDEIMLTNPEDRISRVVQEASGTEAMQLVTTVSEQLARSSMYTAGVGTTMRRIVKLPLLTGRQITDAYDKYFDGAISKLRDFVKLKSREINRLMTQSFNISHKWSQLKKKNPEQERMMSELMGLATMYGVHPDAAFNSPRNVHLRENTKGSSLPQKQVDANKKRYDEVKAMWEKLDGAYREHYRQVESYYGEDWNDVVKYIKVNILRQYEVNKHLKKGGMSEAELERLVNALKKSSDVDSMMQMMKKASPDALNEDAELKLADELKYVLGRAKLKGPYFPLRRFGDYVVRMYGQLNEESFATKKDASAHRQEKAWEDPSLKFTAVKELGDGRFGYTWQEQLVEFYELKGEADQRVRELEGQLGDGYTVMPVDRKKEYTANERISNVLFERVIGRLEDNPHLQNAFKAAAIEMMPETSIKKAQLRRSNVRGYSNDMQRAFARHATSSSHYLSQLRYGHELGAAMRNVEQKIGGSNTLIMRDVYNELKKRDELDASPPQENAVLDAMASYSFFHFLGSPSYWFINSTQPHMITTPWLGAKYGFNNARKAMSKAYSAMSGPVLNNMRDAMKQMGKFGEIPPELFDFLMEGAEGQTTIFTAMQESIRKGKFLTNESANQVRTNEIISMLDRLGELNIISMTFAADTRSIAAGRADSKLGRVMDYSRIMPHLVEVMNRTVTATAAYNLARDNGMTQEEATQYAEQAVAETQFDYSTENKPRYFNQKQFVLARPILMFQQHTQHMYVMLLKNIVQAIGPAFRKYVKGEVLTAEEQEQMRLARRTFMGITGTHMAMAGVVGGLFEPIKWAIGLGAMVLGGDDDEPKNLTQAWRRNTKGVIESLGFDKESAATLERLMNQGAIPGMLGVDLQTRIGLNRMIYWDDDQGKEGREWYRNMVIGALGPMSSIFEGIAATPEYVRKGDYYGALQASTPKLFRDMFKAAGLSTRGMLDYNGNSIRTSSDVEPTELLITALGLTPSRTSETYAERRAINSAKRFFDQRRADLMERYYRADAGGKRRLMQGPIARFNRAVPNARLRITSKTLTSSAEQRRLRESQMRRDAAYTSDSQRGIKERYGGVGDI